MRQTRRFLDPWIERPAAFIRARAEGHGIKASCRISGIPYNRIKIWRKFVCLADPARARHQTLQARIRWIWRERAVASLSPFQGPGTGGNGGGGSDRPVTGTTGSPFGSGGKWERGA